LNNIKWFLNFLLEWKKSVYPFANIGKLLILSGLGSWIPTGLSAVLELPPNSILSQLSFDYGSGSLISEIISIIVITFGMLLIIFDARRAQKSARLTSRVLIQGITGHNMGFPDELLTFVEKSDARELVYLGSPESETIKIEDVISLYNSECKVKIFDRFIMNQNCQKVYIGGLARIPILVSYGACFSRTGINVTSFDRLHSDGKWTLLNKSDENVSLIEFNLQNIHPNESGEIGLAIGFSRPVRETQLPEGLQQNTLFIEPNKRNERNMIMNSDNLQRITQDIQHIIDELSSKDNCKNIHLFLSVQASLAFEIGRKYQDGVHKNWIIHNFNSDKGIYDWALKLSKSEIKLITY
jgi:hypothetical protein